MINRFFISPLILLLLLTACHHHHQEAMSETLLPKTPVQVIHVQHGFVRDEITVFGTTLYLKKNIVTSPIPAFIIQVNVRLGDKVNKGDVLYILQSKESRALGIDAKTIDTTFKNLGIIQVKAPATGIITTLDKQQSGDYVLEGTQLCTIAESNDLAFQINVPYEYTNYTQPGLSCTIILPDNSIHSATFIRALSSMNVLAQTQPFLAKSNHVLFLPENMIVKAVILKQKQAIKQVLPKSCILSDEMMKTFWVMKLLNDTVAVKVPVIIGNMNNQEVEILSPVFQSEDRILLKGNYGLADTALVQIVNE